MSRTVTIQQQNDILQFINNAGTVPIHLTNLGTLQFGAIPLYDLHLYSGKLLAALRTDGDLSESY
jgi:hypothetical protein